MARGFGATFGVGSTDVITSSPNFAFPTTSTLSVWCLINGSGGSTDGVIVNAGASPTVFALRLNGSASAFLGTYPWSNTRLGYSFTDSVGTGIWHHILITYDGSSTANRPIVYINGSSVSVATVTVPIGTFGLTLSSMTVGNTAALNWDGKLAQFSIHSGIFNQSEVTAMAKGVSPFKIRPASLKYYIPLLGVSGEPEWGPSHFVQTLTGTKGQPHSPTLII